MSLLTKMFLVSMLLGATVVLSRWVPRHPRWRPLVILLNLAITGRYLWWRGTQTLNWTSGWGIAVSLAVYLAELYGFLVVLHHYVIATRATSRQAPELKEGKYPPVDVFVATYNESTDILYRTLVGCLAMDYPDKRIHALDDGARQEVADLCRRLGVDYLAREDHAGAKAGNLNHGLASTHADLVATFDADHVPVESFLKETVGFFRNPGVAQVQTAHHFYNPDLFQDQLRIREYIANEQDMFYHIVQPGRDVYNSSFYCGSGAVFRRSALEEIGGFPTATVTEDLHTSMLLHSRGWRSIYLDRNLSAGLAPESYDAFLTQRRRWARGTFQVLLRQGGLFLRGLTLMQRLNYFATFWYWLYGFPRLVYLVAPLLFLLGGLHPLLVRDLSDLLVFYLPHLAVSIAAFQLVNRSMRRIFWSDVYESCISVQVALTALFFPLSRGRGRFRVTPKGHATATGSSWKIAWPLVLLAGLVAVGFFTGLTRLITSGTEQEGLLINTIWAAYNLLVLSLGLLLLRPRPHRRAAIRLPRHLPCHLSGKDLSVAGQTLDLSETGLSVRIEPARPLPERLDIVLTDRQGQRLTVRGRLVRCDVDADNRLAAAVDFTDLSPDQHRRIVELIFSPAHSWSGPHGLTMGAPEHLLRILRSLIGIFSPEERMRRLSPRFRCNLPASILSEDGTSTPARAIDVSVRGAALRLRRGQRPPVPERFRLTLSWNALERTTLEAKVRDVRTGAGGGPILGVVFTELGPQQRADLRKQLYRRPRRVMSAASTAS
ncbi:MAG: PilZ domain-containing protein [Acidobacteriota bacterium]